MSRMILEMTALFGFAMVLYCSSWSNLNGAWILDDKGTITMNPVVLEQTPWIEVWERDFWGHDKLTDSGSHKSWRPLCTASYRLNHHLAGSTDPFWFHLTDRLVHATVAALALPVALFSLGAHLDSAHRGAKRSSALLAAVLFTAHPIHVESVANTTGRAEVLCALFYFAGFLVYAALGTGKSLAGTAASSATRGASGLLAASSPAATTPVGPVRTLSAVAVMLLCTWCSMLCKEHGITLPVLCALWDMLLSTATSVPELAAWALLHLPARSTQSKQQQQQQEEEEEEEEDRRSSSRSSSRSSRSSSRSSTTTTTPSQSPPDPHDPAGGAPGPERVPPSPNPESPLVLPSTSPLLSTHSRRSQELRGFLIRVLAAAAGALVLATWRLGKNGSGDSIPNFSCEQNHGACFHGTPTHAGSGAAAVGEGEAVGAAASAAAAAAAAAVVGRVVEAPLKGGRAGRFWHYSWLWCFNAKLLLWPTTLSPDWSGPSIPILSDPWSDPRGAFLPLLYGALNLVLGTSLRVALQPLLRLPNLAELSSTSTNSVSSSASDSTSDAQNGGAVGGGSSPLPDPTTAAAAAVAEADAPDAAAPAAVVCGGGVARRVGVLGAWWVLLTFVLSSNLFLYVGFVVADRTLFLPSFGFCLLMAQALASPSSSSSSSSPSPSSSPASSSWRSRHSAGLLLGACVACWYSVLTAAQAKRWADPVLVWGEAYRVNPHSCIVGTELGMSLTNAQRPRDAVPVLWDSHKRELEHPHWFTRTIRSEAEKHEAATATHAAALKAATEAATAAEAQLRRRRRSRRQTSDGGGEGGSEEEEEEAAAAIEAAAREAAQEAELEFAFWDPELATWERRAEVFKTRFKLVTALANSGSCATARTLIDEALALLSPTHFHAIDKRTAQAAEAAAANAAQEEEEGEDEEEEGSAASTSPLRPLLAPTASEPRTSSKASSSSSSSSSSLSSSSSRRQRRWAEGPGEYEKAKGALLQSKAYLLVSRSRCGRDLQEMVADASAAVEASPGMAYAQSHLQAVAGIVGELNSQMQGTVRPEQVAVTLVAEEGSQVVRHSYSLKTPAGPTGGATAAAAGRTAAAAATPAGAGAALGGAEASAGTAPALGRVGEPPIEGSAASAREVAVGARGEVTAVANDDDAEWL